MPNTFDENKKVAIKGGNVAKVARKELEANTGKELVSGINAKSLHKLNKGNQELELK